jgi:hypothetical protein
MVVPPLQVPVPTHIGHRTTSAHSSRRTITQSYTLHRPLSCPEPPYSQSDVAQHPREDQTRPVGPTATLRSSGEARICLGRRHARERDAVDVRGFSCRRVIDPANERRLLPRAADSTGGGADKACACCIWRAPEAELPCCGVERLLCARRRRGLSRVTQTSPGRRKLGASEGIGYRKRPAIHAALLLRRLQSFKLHVPLWLSSVRRFSVLNVESRLQVNRRTLSRYARWCPCLELLPGIP